ncbi:MAG: right-handed parallel beta-helix repeat-containing protein [Bacteroidaceae bacterium]|nr:right-handed parallel beta-helix repeat-containing protein [Bacteroidaceae bacterium]
MAAYLHQDNTSKSSKFAYCHISGAKKAIEVYYNKVSVDNCVIKDCSVNGVYLNNSEFGSFTANTISDCEEYPLVIPQHSRIAEAVVKSTSPATIGIIAETTAIHTIDVRRDEYNLFTLLRHTLSKEQRKRLP